MYEALANSALHFIPHSSVIAYQNFSQNTLSSLRGPVPTVSSLNPSPRVALPVALTVGRHRVVERPGELNVGVVATSGGSGGAAVRVDAANLLGSHGTETGVGRSTLTHGAGSPRRNAGEGGGRKDDVVAISTGGAAGRVEGPAGVRVDATHVGCTTSVETGVSRNPIGQGAWNCCRHSRTSWCRGLSCAR